MVGVWVDKPMTSSRTPDAQRPPRRERGPLLGLKGNCTYAPLSADRVPTFSPKNYRNYSGPAR
jgi:hypothetical protein